MKHGRCLLPTWEVNDSRAAPQGQPFEMLEPYDGKLSRTVLRGERGSNAPDLLGREIMEKIKFPGWFILLYAMGDILFTFGLGWALLFGNYKGLTINELWKPGIFVFIIATS